MKKHIAKSIALISVALLLFSCSDKNTNDSQNIIDPYQGGKMTASGLQEVPINGTDQHWNIQAAYQGLSDKMAGKELTIFPEATMKKVSFALGYMTGESSLKTGVMFRPQLQNDKYNPKIVMQGILDQYHKKEPEYTLLTDSDFDAIKKTEALPENISNAQFSYSLGYTKFGVPEEFENLNKVEFVHGMDISLTNKQEKYTDEQIKAISYTMGAFIYNPDNNSFKDQQEKDKFLEGFKSIVDDNSK